MRSMTMDAFDVCAGCRCHIKRQERRCPFCGTSHVPGPVASRNVARMSRARWLAFGSTLTLMSCTDSTAKPTDDAAGVDTAQSDSPNDALGEISSDDATDTNIVADAGEEAGADAAHADAEDAPSDSIAADMAPRDVGDGDAPDGTRDATADRDANPDFSLDGGMDVADDGAFPCCLGGMPCSTVCDRKTQVCDLTTIPGPRSPSCFTIHTDAGDYPAQCVPEPSCWCMDPFFVGCGSGPSSTYSCRDDGGGVMISCNGCYGAPPVRWERWVDPTRGVA